MKKNIESYTRKLFAIDEHIKTKMANIENLEYNDNTADIREREGNILNDMFYLREKIKAKLITAINNHTV